MNSKMYNIANTVQCINMFAYISLFLNWKFSKISAAFLHYDQRWAAKLYTDTQIFWENAKKTIKSVKHKKCVLWSNKNNHFFTPMKQCNWFQTIQSNTIGRYKNQDLAKKRIGWLRLNNRYFKWPYTNAWYKNRTLKLKILSANTIRIGIWRSFNQTFRPPFPSLPPPSTPLEWVYLTLSPTALGPIWPRVFKAWQLKA